MIENKSRKPDEEPLHTRISVKDYIIREDTTSVELKDVLSNIFMFYDDMSDVEEMTLESLEFELEQENLVLVEATDKPVQENDEKNFYIMSTTDSDGDHVDEYFWGDDLENSEFNIGSVTLLFP